MATRKAPARDVVAAKERARAAVAAALEADLAAVTAAARAAHEAATHPEAKPENDKDTRGLESGYLAAGQSARAAELAAAIAGLKAVVLGENAVVGVGALVTIEDDDGAAQRLFVLPAGAGVTVDIDGAPAKVVTPKAPLITPLLNKGAGYDAEVVLGGKRRAVSLLAVE